MVKGNETESVENTQNANSYEESYKESNDTSLMRTSVYRFLKKGTKELAKKLLEAGFDGDQRNGTGHIKFTHPVSKVSVTILVNLNSYSRLGRSIDKAIEKSNKILKEMVKTNNDY